MESGNVCIEVGVEEIIEIRKKSVACKQAHTK